MHDTARAPRTWIAVRRLALGGLLAGGLLWVAFHGTDWWEVLQALRLADLRLLALALALNLAGTLIRVVRWRRLLRPLGETPSLGRAWRCYVIGLGFSSVMAGRLGDLVRPYLIVRPGKAPFAGALATVVTEHILDLLMVLALFGLMLIFPEVLGSATPTGHGALALALLNAAGLTFGVTALGALAATTALTLWPAAFLRLLRRSLTPLPDGFAGRVNEMAASFSAGMSARRDPGHHLAVAGWTLAAWVVMVLATHAHLEAFGLHTSMVHAAWLAGAIAMGVLIPTPGAVGTYQATALVVVGELWGLGAGQQGAVVAFALVSHLAFALVVTVLASWYLLREGRSVRDVADGAMRASLATGEPT